MLYVPSIFGDNLMEDWFDGFDQMFGRMNRQMDKKLYGKNAGRLMKTDVRELEDGYEVDIDIPGFKKEDLQIQLEKGYLTINAAKSIDESETEKDTGKVLRQERYTGNMTRSFYVGEDITDEDIRAKFEDGVLRLSVPKKDVKKLAGRRTIAIEG